MNDVIASITKKMTQSIFENIFKTKKLDSILDTCSDNVVFFCPEKSIGITNKEELIALNSSCQNPLDLEELSITDYAFEIKYDRNLFEVLTTINLINPINSISYTMQAIVIYWICQDSDVKVINISLSRPRNSLKKLTNKEINLLNLISCSILYLNTDEGLTIENANNTFYKLYNNGSNKLENKAFTAFVANYNLSRLQAVVSSIKANTPVQPIKLTTVDITGKLRYVIANLVLARSENGKEFLHCILSDITEEEQLNIKLKAEYRRFIALAEISDSTHIEYDLENDCLHFIKSKDNSIIVTEVKAFTEKSARMGLFEENDFEIFLKLKDTLLSTTTDECYSFEAELNLSKKRTVWVNIKLKKVYVPEFKKYMVYGVISDIDKAKKEKLRLIEKSNTDLLTKFFNKVATEKAIKKYLKHKKENEIDALFIIDIDNFKAVNDNLGHLYGDEILKAGSLKIKELFRSSDILGRIGGDEFVVFMKEVYSREIVEKKAKALCDCLRRSLPYGNTAIDISASIGIAFTAVEEMDFMSLFKNADSALYNSKNQGKNQYCIYGSDTLAMSDMTATKRIASKVDSSLSETAETVGFKLFNALYKASDLKQGLNTVTDYLMDYYAIDRVLILTFDKAKLNFYYSFQNCKSAELEIACINEEFNFNCENDLISLFDKDGLFYCSDVNGLEEPWKSYLSSLKVKSTLQTMLYKNNQINGILCLDDCQNKKMWTKHDIEILTNTAMVLNQFMISDN